jgi:hypothetical protein
MENVKMARRIVTTGQQYQRAEGALARSVWRVSRIFNDQRGVPHAVVVNVDDHTNSKTLAGSILLDRRRFEPVEADGVEDAPVSS